MRWSAVRSTLVRARQAGLPGLATLVLALQASLIAMPALPTFAYGLAWVA